MIESWLSFNFVSFMPAALNILLEALVPGVSAYLSERYTTCVMPLWIIAFAHSLQGKRAT